jgi:uncharacterized protein YjiS (DUF1127 family)
MSFITTNPVLPADYSSEQRRGGFFARLMRGINVAQEERARQVVRRHLRTLSDSDLSRYGYSPEEIKSLRKGF